MRTIVHREVIDMGMVACFTAIAPQELQRLREDPDEIEEFLYPDGGNDEPPNFFDLDKSWHGLHYLFTGETYGGKPPLSQAVLGGVEFGEDGGYGPARYLEASEVRDIAGALAKVTPDALAQRFNPQDMESRQIYPEIWVSEGDEALDLLLDGFDGLKRFYVAAAARGDAVVQWIA
jgi:hypothetical protein